jgi:hypothetical protein
MARLTLMKPRTPLQECIANLEKLRDHIAFMIEFYHRRRAELGLLPDLELPRPKTPLETAAELTWGNQEPTP